LRVSKRFQASITIGKNI